MIKIAVQHKKEVDLSIAAVQLNTIIRYIFSEQYRILNRSTYRRMKFHLGYSIFKKQRKKVFIDVVDFYLFIFWSVHCKIKSFMKKKKQRRKYVAMSVQTRMKKCNDPIYKKITRHIILKLILIKCHSTHTILYCASTMWSFKVSNFIVFTSFTGRNKI